MSLLKQIVEGIYYLPEKDIPIAEEYLDSRNFEELIFLVESSLYRIEQNLNSAYPKKEYEEIDTEKLEYLLDNLNDYYSELENGSIKTTDTTIDDFDVFDEDYYEY